MENRVLALVGFHEKPVLDKMLELGAQEFMEKPYRGVVLTGTSDPKLVISGETVYNELRYMEMALMKKRGDIPIIGQIPARTLMGNIKGVLQEHPMDVTFFLDRSQIRRAKEIFLPYFQERIPGTEGIEMVAPEESFRAGTSYEEHSKKMDDRYALALSNPVTARITETLCCADNWLTRKLVALKNQRIQKASS